MRRGRALALSGSWITVAVGAVAFCVAYDDGGYSLACRSTLAVAVWWTVLVGVGLGVWPRGRITRGALVPGVLFALLAGWDLASTAWSASAEDAFGEFDRTALYLGIYVLVVSASSGRRLSRWIDGLTLAIVGIGVVALISRLFPGSFPSRGLPTLLPSAGARLSFPLDYWNGLGIFVGLGFPLLLHDALGGDRRRRAAALGVLPALGAVVYLTSSRGAVAALAGGSLVFVLAQPRRWAALVALLAAATGVGAAVAVLLPRHELVDGPLASAAARNEGWQAAVLLVVTCVGTAAVVEVGVAVMPRLPVPTRAMRRLCVAAIAAVTVAGAAHEAHALEGFTRLPVATTEGNKVAVHLLSGGGSGRWQFWKAAFDEFLHAPLHGGGAGSFEAWWAEHATFPYFVSDAHSLFFQTLGELGIIGLVLLIGMLGSGLFVATRRVQQAQGAERTAIAGLLGAFTVYLIGASVDWMWELTAVTAVGVCALALLTGPATLVPAPAQVIDGSRMAWRRSVAVAIISVAILVTEAIALLGDVEVSTSQADVRAGSLGLARSHAIAATRIEPWAATPYLQLALVDESAGELAPALSAIDESIRRDHDDWRPWLIAAQIEMHLGEPTASARSLARAKALDPRSPLVSGSTGPKT